MNSIYLLFQLNKFAEEVEHEVRTTVIQAVEKEPGRFGKILMTTINYKIYSLIFNFTIWYSELRITSDTALLDNVPYMDSEGPDQVKSDKQNTSPCSNTSSKDKVK